MAETDSGWLGGLLGRLGVGSYDPQAAYAGLLSDQATKDALRARSLASVAQAFGAGAGSDARGSAIPFGATVGNAAAAAYAGQDELIKARLLAAQTAQQAAQTGLLNIEGPMFIEQFKQAQKDAEAQRTGADGKPKPGTPLDLIGKTGGDTYWTPQGLAALRPTEGAYDQIHYPSGRPSTASGAYGFLDDTWKAFASKAGVDIEKYPRAYMAPPEVQDKVAAITPISHWTRADAKGNPYNFRAQRLATNPDYVTGGAQMAAVDRPVTPTEADIYRKAPFPTVQNAGVVPPPVMTDKLPTGTIAPNPFNTPTGGTPGSTAAPAGIAIQYPPGGGQPIDPRTGQPVSPTGEPIPPPAAPAVPQGGVTGQKLGGLLGTQADPVTAQTVAALGNTRGGVNAGGDVTGGLLASLVPRAGAPPGVGGPPGGDIRTALGAAGAPPAAPPAAALAQLAQAAGAPPIAPAAPPMPPPMAQGAVGTDKGGGLLNGPPPPPVAPAPVAPPIPAPAAPAAPGPLGAPPVMPGTPALPPMPTLPSAPQMQSIPVPGVGAGTPQERMAQALTGIMALTGRPAPAWLDGMAKMSMERATELYKAQLTQETNRVNELYKTQLQTATAEYTSAATARGKAPYEIAQELAKQGIRVNPQTGQAEWIPEYLALKGQEVKQQQDLQQSREIAVAQAREAATALGRTQTEQAKQDYELKLLPQRERTQFLGKEYAENVSKPSEAAEPALRSLTALGNSLDQFRTGPTAQLRLDAQKRLQDIGSLFGIQPNSETARMIAAGEIINKQGTSLGYQMAKELGSREAQMIVQQAILANPGLANSPEGNKQLIQLIGQGLQRDIAKQNFYDQHFQATGSYEGARQAFQAANPWQVSVSNAVPFQVRDAADLASKNLPAGTHYVTPDTPAGHWHTVGAGAR